MSASGNSPYVQHRQQPQWHSYNIICNNEDDATGFAWVAWRKLGRCLEQLAIALVSALGTTSSYISVRVVFAQASGRASKSDATSGSKQARTLLSLLLQIRSM